MNALVPVEQTRAQLVAGGRIQAVVPQTMEDAYRLGKVICTAGMAPNDMDTPEKCMVAIMHGLEIGLPPMTALQRIAVVNGRPTLWGDGAMSLVRGSGLCEYVNERIEGTGDSRAAVCEVKRKNEREQSVRRFSVDDAKRAKLWGRSGPWTQYPDRMLQMRARAFALRDLFADVLCGMYLREEIEEDRSPRGETPPPAPRREQPQPTIEHQPSRHTERDRDNAPVEDAGAAGADAPGPQASASSPSQPAHDTDGVVSAESLLEELDERLGFAKTADEVDEGYTDFDAEALLSDYEGGVEQARALKAKHLDRVAKSADQPKPKPQKSDGSDFPGNAQIAANARAKDLFAIPASFKGGGHYQIFIGDAADAAKPGDRERLIICWNNTIAQRDALLKEGQLSNSDVEGLRERVMASLDRIKPQDQPDDSIPPAAPRRSSQAAEEAAPAPANAETPAEPAKPASGDPVAAYTARMEAAFADAKTKEDVDKFWFGTVDERDGMGVTEDQRSKWKIARSKAKNPLPSEEG